MTAVLILPPFTLLTSHFSTNSRMCQYGGGVWDFREQLDANSFIDEVILCSGRARCQSVTQKMLK